MSSGQSSRPTDPVGRLLERIALVLAGLGGIVLLIIVSVSFVSIIGRFLFSSPLLGDFELVEMGCAVAIGSFLPLCQLRRGNVIVDFATAGLPPRVNAFLDGVSAVLYALVASFFTWRMYYGAQDMFRYSEETMLLRTPVWIPFLPVVFSFFLLAICCFYTAYRSFRHTMIRI